MPHVLKTIILMLALSACAGPAEDESEGSTDATGEETGEAAAVTYHRDVRPLLIRHCLACHQSGGIAPMALDSAAAAAPFAGLIAEATASRAMPPFPADNSGACHSFRDARWLDDDELALLAAWAEAGAPEGDPASAPPDPPPPPPLDGEVRTLAMAAPYTPQADLADDYRCFVIEGVAPADEETFVTGFDVRPGNPRIVHHVIVYAPRSPEAAEQVRALDAAEPGAGYTCFGTAQVPAAVAAAWAPGGGATRYPEGIGVRLQPGAPVVVQMHYNTLAGPGMSDRTEVDLRVVADGVTPARFAGIADLGLALAPGEEEVTVQHTSPIGKPTGAPLRVHGVFPHMHTLGRSLTIRHPAGDACVIDVPRYAFHWQLLYFYERPIDLPADPELEITCRFDTRTRTEVTRWGEGTLDEMCVAGLLVTDE